MTQPALVVCAAPIEQGPHKGQPATGTYAGYRRHRRASEPPCDACHEARSIYDRAYREANPDRFREANLRYYYSDLDGNRKRTRERKRKWRRTNPDRAREAPLQRNYGLTVQAFDELLAQQGGVCAICGVEPPDRGKNKWHIDHDHACCPTRPTCGECVRGILCSECNQGLGKIGEANLRAAIDYLEGR